MRIWTGDSLETLHFCLVRVFHAFILFDVCLYGVQLLILADR